MLREWRYADGPYHYSDGKEVVLARLTVRDDGTAEVLFADGRLRQFDSEDEARTMLSDEEYRYVADLIEDNRLSSSALPPLDAETQQLSGRLRIRIG